MTHEEAKHLFRAVRDPSRESAPPSLPEDLQQHAVRRLGALALALAGVMVVGSISRHFALARGMVEDRFVLHSDIVQLSLAALSVGIFALARSNRFRSEPLLLVGLVYEVVLCASTAFMERIQFDFGSPPVRLSFAILVLMAFPVVVPTTPTRRIVTTLICAASLPAGGLVGNLFGASPLHATFFPMAYLPTWVGAGLGILLWRIVYGLGRQIREIRRLGSYELVEKLGAGGMGDLWKARHRMLLRPAAIKLIRPQSLRHDAATSVRRFEREAQTTGALRSPHTVELYDFGMTPDGTFFYAMELLSGVDLDRLVRRWGPLPPNRVIHLLKQACRSLGEAHEQGLVHRDIKPANLYLTRLGNEFDFVKVLDFGLVKLHDEPREEAKLSQEGTIVGTPAFLPPELILGGAVDGRADLYALGCVAYWMLSGKLVFDQDNAMKLAMDHVQQAPTPPSERVDVPIPREVEQVVMHCLAKKPSDRPQDADTLHDMLDACPVSPLWSGRDAEAWWIAHEQEIENLGGQSTKLSSQVPK